MSDQENQSQEPVNDALLEQIDPLKAEAMRWFVKLHGDPDDQALQAQFEVWRQSDSRHATAYTQVEHLWDVSLHAPGTQQAYRGHTRRQFLRKAAVGGGVGIAAIGGFFLLTDSHLFAQYRTGTGQRRTITLSDGSTVELSTRTSLSLSFNERERGVHLYEGEVYFKIARDSMARPFTVLSKYGEATALGTEFSVAILEDATRLAVTEHSVRIDSGNRELVVEAGQAVRYGKSGVGRVEPLPPSELSWRAGHLEFISAPLRDVVHTLDQWRTGKTVLADEGIGQLHVTMLIDLAHVTESLEQLPSILPVKTVEVTPLLTIIYPV